MTDAYIRIARVIGGRITALTGLQLAATRVGCGASTPPVEPRTVTLRADASTAAPRPPAMPTAAAASASPDRNQSPQAASAPTQPAATVEPKESTTPRPPPADVTARASEDGRPSRQPRRSGKGTAASRCSSRAQSSTCDRPRREPLPVARRARYITNRSTRCFRTTGRQTMHQRKGQDVALNSLGTSVQCGGRWRACSRASTARPCERVALSHTLPPCRLE